MKNKADNLSDLTIKCFDATAEHVSNLWVKVLEKRGIPLEDLNSIRSDIFEKNRDGLILANNKCLSICKNYSKNISANNRRSDHFGRAVINYGFSKYLPKTIEERERILSEPISGKLPHPVVVSMITCIQNALGTDTLSAVEKELNEIKEKYKDSKSLSVEWNKFLVDSRVVEIVESSFMKLRKLFAGRDDDRRRDWIENILLNSRAFEKINRNLTDEEYLIIAKALFE